MKFKTGLIAVGIVLALLVAWYAFGQDTAPQDAPKVVQSAPSGWCQMWNRPQLVDRGTNKGRLYCCITGAWGECRALTGQESDGNPSLTSVTTVKVNQATGIDLSSDGTNTVTIAGHDADADGTTKGVATYTPADFNADGSGRIAIDYANGQECDGTLDGYISAAKWNAFTLGIVTADAHSGLVLYSDATDATHDTGTLLCTIFGRTCVTTFTLTGTASACSTDYNADGTQTAFEAVCR